MTTLIKIGKNGNNQNKKPIVFEYSLWNLPPAANTFEKADTLPKSYKYIELICRNYLPNQDLMFAYNDPDDRSGGHLYVGNWNDGVIE